MNGRFLSHLIRAAGYAFANVGSANETEEAAPAIRKRAKKPGCCKAKRPAAAAPITEAPPESSFAEMPPVRSRGRGSNQG